MGDPLLYLPGRFNVLAELAFLEGCVNQIYIGWRSIYSFDLMICGTLTLKIFCVFLLKENIILQYSASYSISNGSSLGI